MKEQNSFESALALHLAGALTDAEIAYRFILSSEPQHVEATHYLGVLLHQTGNTLEALSMIHGALELDNGSACRYNDLGNILSQTGDLADAAAAFRLSLELNVNDANVWNNFGSVLRRQKDFAGAEAAYRNALRHEIDFVPALDNLAVLLAEMGREEESSLYVCQAYIQPPLADKPLKILGYAYYRLGRLADAAECYREWLTAEPDNAFARHHLAACTGENVPDKASDDYLTMLFNDMAGHFEEKLVGKLKYCGPEIIAGLLDGYIDANKRLDVLDAGCGTGLCAPILTPYARRLTGVDISPGMLAKATEKKRYDELIEAELTAYLHDRENAFDLIVMADTLIYFGDLAALFAVVRQALRPGEMFAFTVEAAEIDQQLTDYHFNASGRYSHSRRYLEQLLDAQAFNLLRIEDAIVRMELGRPTHGFGVLAQAFSH